MRDARCGWPGSRAMCCIPRANRRGGIRETGAVPIGCECRGAARPADRPRRGRHLRRGQEGPHAAAHHAGHHRRLRRLEARAGEARRRRPGGAGRQGPAQGAAAAARQNPLLHRQLLGARPARGAAAQHVHEEPRRRGRAGRHHRAAGIHRAVGVHARGRAGAGDQGPGQDGEGRGLAQSRVRLHLPDRRLGARAGPPHLAGDAADELARQVVRHLLADRPVHRHRRRDRGPQRRRRAVLERRPASPQLQHRRHGAPRPRAGRVGDHGDDA